MPILPFFGKTDKYPGMIFLADSHQLAKTTYDIDR